MEVLSNKSYRQFDYISRYQSFPYYYNRIDNKYIYGTTGQLDDTIGYSVHICKANDTWDSIALLYYNSPTLFWVLCDFNKVQDPFQPLKIGDRVKIPTISSISYTED